MRTSGWPPSTVPRDDDHNVYLVLDDLGRSGRIWPESEADSLAGIISAFSLLLELSSSIVAQYFANRP